MEDKGLIPSTYMMVNNLYFQSQSLFMASSGEREREYIELKLGVLAHEGSTGRRRQVDLFEFEATLATKQVPGQQEVFCLTYHLLKKRYVEAERWVSLRPD